MGTSLQVQPFANLIDYVSPTTPRLLINREECGVYHSKYGFDFTGKIQEYRRDAVYLGNCDEACQIIANEMGWKTEFEELRGTSGGKTGFDIELLVKELHRVGLE
jgi:hypothetical protein